MFDPFMVGLCPYRVSKKTKAVWGLIFKSVDKVVTVGLLLRWHIPWCFILRGWVASSHQKTALNFDPVQGGPINTLCPGDGQTQKLWHIQPSSSVPSAANPWLCAASTTTKIIRAVINFCQHHRNTKTPPAPTCLPCKHSCHTNTHKDYPRLFWANIPATLRLLTFTQATTCWVDRRKQVNLYTLPFADAPAHTRTHMEIHKQIETVCLKENRYSFA